jgi:hypothetical protein
MLSKILEKIYRMKKKRSTINDLNIVQTVFRTRHIIKISLLEILKLMGDKNLITLGMA